jgi:hypothetical protein
VRVAVWIFAVADTLRVVEFINGIVNVSKLNIVLEAFEVNPAATIFDVVIAFVATRLLVRTNEFKFEI